MCLLIPARRRIPALFTLLVIVFASACELGVSLPESVMPCDDDTDCPSGWFCEMAAEHQQSLCFKDGNDSGDFDARQDSSDSDSDAGQDATGQSADTGIGTEDAIVDSASIDSAETDSAPSDAGRIDASDSGELDASEAGDADSDAEDTSTQSNRDPVIDDLTADPDSIVKGGVSEVICTAHDPDDDDLSYEWEATAGSIEGSADDDPWRVNWTAPDTAGSYDVQCSVQDEHGGRTEESVSIGVSDSENTPPSITAISIGSRVLIPDVTTSVFCIADDPDPGDALSFSWQANSGTFENASENPTSWTAGSPLGEISLECHVADGNNGTDDRSETVRVYPTGLVAYYDFSLNTNDASGNGHNGSDTSAAFSNDSSGNPSSSLAFDGTDSVTIADHDDFDFFAYSFVAVVNLTAADQDRTLVSKTTSTSYGNFTIRVLSDVSSTPGRLAVSHEGDLSLVNEVTTDPFPVGEFVHLAITVSSATGITVYINGTPVHQSPVSIVAPYPNLADILLGNGPKGGFIGILDEVQFYNRVLVPDEVAALVPMQ